MLTPEEQKELEALEALIPKMQEYLDAIEESDAELDKEVVAASDELMVALQQAETEFDKADAEDRKQAEGEAIQQIRDQAQDL